MNLCNAWSVQVNGVSSFVSLHARSGSHRQQSYPAFPIGWGGLRQAPHSLANRKSLPLTRSLGATFGTHEFAGTQSTSSA